ncbi:MAG TPA: hemerythrin domain-containing protein [Chloroflexota bacterium]
MRASEVLKGEHRGIERMLRALEKEAGELEAGKRVDPAALEQHVDFLRNFADRCHHTKEETELFPALQKAGVAVEGGPIGVMLDDHEHGRAYIRSMVAELKKYSEGDAAAAARLAAAIHGYVELLTAHIWKEDNVLFAMADKMLPEATQAELIARFDRIEAEEMGPGVHERYHQMLDELDAA